MTGLILKDFMVMKKTLFIYAIIGVVYGYMDLTQERHGVMFAMMLICSAMVPVSSISYDERCKWDKLANTTPVSRSGIIIAKYLFALILTAISSVYVFCVYLMDKEMTIVDNISLVAVMALIAMFYQAVLMPIIIKFGSEKGRMFMMIALFLPIALIGVVIKLVPGFTQMLDRLIFQHEHLLPLIMTGAVLIVYILSMILSINIYKSKDL